MPDRSSLVASDSVEGGAGGMGRSSSRDESVVVGAGYPYVGSSPVGGKAGIRLEDAGARPASGSEPFVAAATCATAAPPGV
jgi:hypothetical protein